MKAKILRCPDCGSLAARSRVATGTVVCRHCGYEGTREEFESLSLGKPKQGFKCPKCGYMTVEYRFKEKKFLCRRCSYRGKREEFIFF